MPFNDIIDIPIIRPEKVVENDYENKNTYTKQDALKMCIEQREVI